MNNNINLGPGFASMSTEDRIRALVNNGVGVKPAKIASDASEYQAMFGGDSTSPEVHALGMAEFLRRRGHNVNVNL